jgi:signal peptidase
MSSQGVKKAFKGIGRALSIVLIVFEVLIIVFLVVSKVQGNPPTLFGHQMYFIRTGSMSPYLEPGDVIISKKYDGGELVAGNDGDVVTYYGDVNGNVEMITHRVIEIDGEKIVTKGDFNNTVDSPITKNDIEAVMVYKTVVIDKIYMIISSTWGFWLLIFTPIALLIVSEIVSLVKELKREKEEADENEEGNE